MIVVIMKKKLKNYSKNKYKQRKDYGIEYFEGDL